MNPGSGLLPSKLKKAIYDQKRMSTPEYKAHRASYLEKARKDPEYYEKRRAQRRARFTGWSREDFELAWVAQGGRCAVCNRAMKKSGFSIDSAQADHCHKTQKKRGILCNRCNRGMGSLGDDLGLIRNMVRYLEYWEQKDA